MLSLRLKSKSNVDQVGLIGTFLIGQVPSKWLVLNQNHYLDPEKYSALFSKIGYMFGKDGMNRFLLPKLDSEESLRGYFLKLKGVGENNGQLVTTSERPRHRHSRSVGSNGAHSHILPSQRYLRNVFVSGCRNEDGGGTAYSEPTTATHTTHGHADSSSGGMTAIAASNKGAISAPPSVEAIMAIYAGV